MTAPVTAHRPKLLGFLTILWILVGALQAISGVFVVLGRNKKEVLDALDSTSSNDATIIGVYLIVAGVVAILIAGSLRSGKNWARLLVGTVALVNVGALIWAAFSYHHLHWYNVAWPALIYALIAGYFFSDEDVKRYFAA